jgi:hypothetical protein
MPGFPFPGRPGGEHDEPLLDMIIARRVLPPDAPQPMHDLARMLAALAGPAEPGELAGEAAVRAAFSRAASPASISPAARQPGRRRRARRPARSRARLATVLLVAAAGLGSVFAAYSGVLPSPIHATVAAPAAHGSAVPRALGQGKPVPSHTRPSSTPASHLAAGPHHSARSSASASPWPSLKTYYKPYRPPSPGHRPVCTPSAHPAPGTAVKPSAYPSVFPWSQGSGGEQCTSIPAGQSTGNPTHP